MTQQAERRSVQTPPSFDDVPRSSLVVQLATVADDLEPWGRNQRWRDIQLRSFWRTEPVLASAIYNVVIRNSAFSWRLEGPPRTVKATQAMLHRADQGNGWLSFAIKLGVDIYTQDNGAFIELIRATSSKNSPVIGIGNLDSGRCRRTGRRDKPVIYQDRQGALHWMEAHQVISVAEFPSPIETMYGSQMCAVSRILRAAQLLRDVSVFRREKVAGRNPHAIHLVSGIQRSEIEDAIEGHTDQQDNAGFARYMKPVILATLDPTATVDVKTLEIATLPDNFDEDVLMRWYINQLAIGFGADYQDFAPLPGRGLGSSTQALVLHEKARGKGPALFMKTMEHLFNFHGVIPGNVTFRYDEQDLAEEMEKAEIEERRAKTRQVYVDSGVLDTAAVRQDMLDKEELSQEEFDRLQAAEDSTGDVTAIDAEPVDTPHPETGVISTATAEKQEATEAVSDFDEAERRVFEDKVEGDMAAALAAFFRKLSKQLLKSDVKAVGRKDTPSQIIGDPELWQDFRVNMVDAMAPNTRDIATAAAQFNADLGLAVDMDLINQQVLDFSRVYTNQWYQKLEETTRVTLNKAVASWQETGLGKRGLPDLVKSLEPTFGRTRAKRIATTEVTRIFDEGNKLAHIDAGIETEEWQTARDAHVCPICGPLDGKRFPTEGGPRPVTDTHIGCRCARLPVVDDEALTTAEGLPGRAEPIVPTRVKPPKPVRVREPFFPEPLPPPASGARIIELGEGMPNIAVVGEVSPDKVKWLQKAINDIPPHSRVGIRRVDIIKGRGRLRTLGKNQFQVGGEMHPHSGLMEIWEESWNSQRGISQVLGHEAGHAGYKNKITRGLKTRWEAATKREGGITDYARKHLRGRSITGPEENFAEMHAAFTISDAAELDGLEGSYPRTFKLFKNMWDVLGGG